MKFVSIIGTVLAASAVSAVPCKSNDVSVSAQPMAGGNPAQQPAVPKAPEQRKEESDGSPDAARPERPVGETPSTPPQGPSPQGPPSQSPSSSHSSPHPKKTPRLNCNRGTTHSLPEDTLVSTPTTAPNGSPVSTQQVPSPSQGSDGENLGQGPTDGGKAQGLPETPQELAPGTNRPKKENTDKDVPDESLPNRIADVPNDGAGGQGKPSGPPSGPQPSTGSGQPKTPGQEYLPKQQPSDEVLSKGKEISATSHQQFSSSIGVLGCKIETDFVAYWPEKIDCDNICVEVAYEDRSVYLLRVDNSGGAHDISYNAFNYLATGKYATEGTGTAQAFGGITMKYTTVDAEKCKPLLKDGVLPMSAPTGSGLTVACSPGQGSWSNLIGLYNIYNPLCTIGKDDKCTFDRVTNQFDCGASKLGDQTPITNSVLQVWDVKYMSGKRVKAL